MSDPVHVTNVGYMLSGGFNDSANRGLCLYHIGVPNTLAQITIDFLTSRNAFINATTLNRYQPSNGSEVEWVDIEAFTPYQKTINHDELYLWLVHAITSSDFVLDILDMSPSLYSQESMFTRLTNETFTGAADFTPYTSPYVFHGVSPKQTVMDTDYVRVITLYTSPETPLVDSYYRVDSLSLRTSGVVYLSPRADNKFSFAFAQGGAGLIEELNTVVLEQDYITSSLIRNLMNRSKTSQYHIALLVNAMDKLYNNISVEVFTSIVQNLSQYDSVIELLTAEPTPDMATIRDAFAAV